MLWPRVEAHHCTSVGWNSRRTLIGCARACSFCQWGGLTVLPLIHNINLSNYSLSTIHFNSIQFYSIHSTSIQSHTTIIHHLIHSFIHSFTYFLSLLLYYSYTIEIQYIHSSISLSQQHFPSQLSNTLHRLIHSIHNTIIIFYYITLLSLTSHQFIMPPNLLKSIQYCLSICII